MRTLKDSWIFLFFSAFVLALYFPTRQAGFVTDFYGWQEKFNSGSYAGVFNTFGWHANQQVAVFFMYTFYLLFGVSGWGWYIGFSLLHALNGLFAFKFFNRLFQNFKINHSTIVPFAGALLFLVSPYQAEVLVWRVCIHYLLVSFFTLLILWQTLNFLETGNRKKLWIIHAVFFFSLFTLELSLITPLLIAVVGLTWNSVVKKEKRWWSGLPPIILPQFGLIGFFFLVNKIVLDEWVGHYGASVHFNLSFHDIFSNYFRYFIKYLLFARYFDHPVKMKIFGVAETGTGIDALLSLFVVVFVSGLIFYRKLSNTLKMAGMSLLLFFIALTPVVTLYLVTLLYGENDRYGYLASVFFWMSAVTFLSAISRNTFYVVFGMLLAVSLFLLVKTNSWWAENNRIYSGLLNNFHWYDKDEVIILNIPDNYRGLYMFRIYHQPSGLKEGLNLIRKEPYRGEMREVTQFNMMTPQDGVTVKVDSVDRLTITFNQYGNWWWWQGIGNSDFENERYKVHFDGISYHLLFKSLKPNHAIIYQQGDRWLEVPM